MSISIEFEGLHNVRDLGGMPAAGASVKPGVLFRGDQLFFATESDRSKVDELGIRTVIDFRSAPERAEKPDPDIPGVRNLHLPVIQDVRAGIAHDSESNASMVKMIAQGADIDRSLVDTYMQKMYAGFVEGAEASEQYGRFFDEVVLAAERGEALFWHCTAGKDRAGFATVVVLEALGVARDDIFDDYLETNARLSAVVEQLIATVGRMLPSEGARDAARRFFRADASYLVAAYETADRLYGSFDAYLERALGVDAGKRKSLRCALLE